VPPSIACSFAVYDGMDMDASACNGWDMLLRSIGLDAVVVSGDVLRGRCRVHIRARGGDACAMLCCVHIYVYAHMMPSRCTVMVLRSIGPDAVVVQEMSPEAAVVSTSEQHNVRHAPCVFCCVCGDVYAGHAATDLAMFIIAPAGPHQGVLPTAGGTGSRHEGSQE